MKKTDLEHLEQINIFGFLVITRSQELGFGRNLVEIVPRSLPELFKQPGDQNNRQNTQKASDKILIEK